MTLWRLPKVLERLAWPAHADTVEALAFSPDSTQLASASRDRNIRLWDVPTGRLQARILGHPARVWCAAYAPDGRSLATAGGDGTVRIRRARHRPACRRPGDRRRA